MCKTPYTTPKTRQFSATWVLPKVASFEKLNKLCRSQKVDIFTIYPNCADHKKLQICQPRPAQNETPRMCQTQYKTPKPIPFSHTWVSPKVAVFDKLTKLCRSQKVAILPTVTCPKRNTPGRVKRIIKHQIRCHFHTLEIPQKLPFLQIDQPLQITKSCNFANHDMPKTKYTRMCQTPYEITKQCHFHTLEIPKKLPFL